MDRSQFTFYRSYYEALKQLPQKEQGPAAMALCEYALNGADTQLTGGAAIVLLLAKPTLDSGRKKASNGKRGGSKPKANEKQTESKEEANDIQDASEIEVEKEKEREIEYECTTPTPSFAAVMSAYLNRVNPSASQQSLDELKGFCEVVGPAVCIRAMDIALDEKKATWSYIRGILRRLSGQGVRCLADWDAVEKRRETQPSGYQGKVPMGASGELGDLERAAIERMKRECGDGT